MWWASLTCTWLGAEGRLSFLFYWQAKRAALEMVVVGLKPSNGSHVSKYPLSRPGNLKDAFLAIKIVPWVPAEDRQLWLSQAGDHGVIWREWMQVSTWHLYDVVGILPSPLWHHFCEDSSPVLTVEHSVGMFLWASQGLEYGWTPVRRMVEGSGQA